MHELELCIASIEEAKQAEAYSVSRVELCAALEVGGLTPSIGTIQQCRKQLRNTELYVLIRPREGDFLYTADELAIIQQDILASKAAGADGVVIGVLQADGHIDINQMEKLLEYAYPMATTFHRAIDVCADPVRGALELVSIGVDRILSSGGQASAFEGKATLQAMHQATLGTIDIMAGGGIHAGNIEAIAATGVSAFHFSCRKWGKSQMQYANPRVSMGKSTTDEYGQWIFDHDKIAGIQDLFRL